MAHTYYCFLYGELIRAGPKAVGAQSELPRWGPQQVLKKSKKNKKIIDFKK